VEKRNRADPGKRRISVFQASIKFFLFITVASIGSRVASLTLLNSSSIHVACSSYLEALLAGAKTAIIFCAFFYLVMLGLKFLITRIAKCADAEDENN
jgi:hypothetical protein